MQHLTNILMPNVMRDWLVLLLCVQEVPHLIISLTGLV